MDSVDIDDELEEPIAPRWQDYIHTDPNILVGKPVVKGTRLGVAFLLQLLAGGWTEEQVLASYPVLTPEAMRATAERVRPLRARVAETLGGGHEVEEWEIAAMHRAHHSAEGACVRATWIQVAPSRIERALDIYRLASIPAMEELEGFCSVSLLVDRETGRCVSTVTFDSLEAMQRTREQDAVIRGKGADEVQAEVLDVAEFELALAHLHVPEMA
jgi:uncharacterized protein (DUF433 family)